MRGKLNEIFIDAKKIDFEPTRFSEISGASGLINKIAEERATLIFQLIEKSIKRYCEIRKIDFESLKENGLLTREVHPSRELFLYDGIEIFRMDITDKNFSNEGCYGTETNYTITEFF